jgi:hypothetical protein
MRSRVLLERFTLVVLCLLAALALFGLVAFLAIQTLNWAIFPKLGERFFMLALPLLLASGTFDPGLNSRVAAGAKVHSYTAASSNHGALLEKGGVYKTHDGSNGFTLAQAINADVAAGYKIHTFVGNSFSSSAWVHTSCP